MPACTSPVNGFASTPSLCMCGCSAPSKQVVPALSAGDAQRKEAQPELKMFSVLLWGSKAL